jgi:uncharacterized spore protein YtfJ
MEPSDMLNALAARVREISSTETVVGDPIVLGDATIVPVTRVTIGFGGGSGSGEANEAGKAQRAGGTGGGGGGGVRIEPAAFIVMQEGKLSVLAAPGKRGALSSLFEHVPDLVEKLSAMKTKKEESEQD